MEPCLAPAKTLLTEQSETLSQPTSQESANTPLPCYDGSLSAWMPRRVLAFDVETTGLIAEYDYVTEIGAAVMKDGEIIGEPLQVKVAAGDRAKIAVGAFTANAGDMTAFDVEEIARRIKAYLSGIPALDATRQFVEWCGRNQVDSLPMVAWNAEFDLSFYSRKILSYTSAWQVPPVSPVTICVMRMFQAAMKDKKAASLDVAAMLYGLAPRAKTDGHSALQDAIYAGIIYHKLLRGDE